MFDKDDRLVKSFYGIAYTPEGSQYPACGNSLGAFSPCALSTLARQLTLCRTF